MRQVYGTKAHRAAGIEDLKPSATRTAVYGTVRTVVWEEGAERFPPTRLRARYDDHEKRSSMRCGVNTILSAPQKALKSPEDDLHVASLGRRKGRNI